MEEEGRDVEKNLPDETFYDTEGNIKETGRVSTENDSKIKDSSESTNTDSESVTDDSRQSDSWESDTDSDYVYSSEDEKSEDDGLTHQEKAEFKLLEKDWELRLNVIEKEGFRAGVETGQEKRLQEGFNKGYKTAAEKIYKLSKCRGSIDALLALHKSNTWINLSEDDVQILQTLDKETGPLAAAVKAGVQTLLHSENCNQETCCGGACKGFGDEETKEAESADAQLPCGDIKSEEAKENKQKTCCQQKERDGQIAYELSAKAGNDQKLSEVSKNIDALHEKVTRILAKYNISNLTDTPTER